MEAVASEVLAARGTDDDGGDVGSCAVGAPANVSGEASDSHRDGGRQDKEQTGSVSMVFGEVSRSTDISRESVRILAKAIRNSH
jgi:hypothetical protein